MRDGVIRHSRDGDQKWYEMVVMKWSSMIYISIDPNNNNTMYHHVSIDVWDTKVIRR